MGAEEVNFAEVQQFAAPKNGLTVCVSQVAYLPGFAISQATLEE
jgi:hypothetical protein